MTQRVVAVVDAYSTSRHLAPLFQARGYACLHVRSAPQVPQIYRSTHDPSVFDAAVVHDHCLDSTATAVAQHQPVAVLAGAESGVELADFLGHRLGLRTNDIRTSNARRDKFAMIERVKEAGLPVAQHIMCHEWPTLRSWYRSIGCPRIVIKPLRSLGNDGVFFCDSEAEASSAFHALLGSRSVLTMTNESVLAQEYIAGEEFVVNSVSLDGRHHVCDIWEQHHLNVNGVRDLLGGSRLLVRRGPKQDELVRYAAAVLDALGVRNGPAHTEIRLTSAGPRLIETGARVSGAEVPLLAGLAVGEGQLEWTVDAYVDPRRFRSRCAADYQVARHAANFHLICPSDGTLKDYPGMPQIRTLESFHGLREYVSPGQVISRTVNDFTYPAMVQFVHEVEGVVRRDFTTARHLDGPGFYRLA